MSRNNAVTTVQKALDAAPARPWLFRAKSDSFHLACETYPFGECFAHLYGTGLTADGDRDGAGEEVTEAILACVNHGDELLQIAGRYQRLVAAVRELWKRHRSRTGKRHPELQKAAWAAIEKLLDEIEEHPDAATG